MVPAPYIAATYACIGEVNGGGFVMIPWHTNYPFPDDAHVRMPRAGCPHYHVFGSIK